MTTQLDKDRFAHDIGGDEHILSPFIFLETRRGMHQVTMDERGTAYSANKFLQTLEIDSAGKNNHTH